MDLSKNKATVIWSGVNPNTLGGYSFDADGKQLAFLVQEAGTTNTIWYYQTGMNKAIIMVSDQTSGIGSLSISNSSPSFSAGGNNIFFYLRAPADKRKPKEGAVQVDIWNYQDSVLQSSQLLDGKPPFFWSDKKDFISTINVKDKKVLRLEQEDEAMIDSCRVRFCVGR